MKVTEQQQQALDLGEVLQAAMLNSGMEDAECIITLIKVLASHVVATSNDKPEAVKKLLDFAIVGSLRESLRSLRHDIETRPEEVEERFKEYEKHQKERRDSAN